MAEPKSILLVMTLLLVSCVDLETLEETGYCERDQEGLYPACAAYCSSNDFEAGYCDFDPPQSNTLVCNCYDFKYVTPTTDATTTDTTTATPDTTMSSPAGPDVTTPLYSGAPETPGYPSSPETPGYPSSPETPDYPSSPETPGYPSSPETPGYPSSPETPGYPSYPSTYETPASSSSPLTTYGYPSSSTPRVPFYPIVVILPRETMKLIDDICQRLCKRKGYLHAQVLRVISYGNGVYVVEYQCYTYI